MRYNSRIGPTYNGLDLLELVRINSITQSFLHERESYAQDNWSYKLQSHNTEVIENNGNLQRKQRNIQPEIHVFRRDEIPFAVIPR